jgi:hypothetical protein
MDFSAFSRGAIWVILVDGEPVGHVVLSVRYAMEFGGLIGYIDDLFVRVEHRRRGCLSLHVEVDPANAPAIGVYRRFGMAPGTNSRLQLKTMLMPPP